MKEILVKISRKVMTTRNIVGIVIAAAVVSLVLTSSAYVHIKYADGKWSIEFVSTGWWGHIEPPKT